MNSIQLMTLERCECEKGTHIDRKIVRLEVSNPLLFKESELRQGEMAFQPANNSAKSRIIKTQLSPYSPPDYNSEQQYPL